MNEIESITKRMNAITNLARAYYNATPEQRSKVSLKDMQAQINEYNKLKEQRNTLLYLQKLSNTSQAQVLQWANNQVINQQPIIRQQPQVQTTSNNDWTNWLVKEYYQPFSFVRPYANLQKIEIPQWWNQSNKAVVDGIDRIEVTPWLWNNTSPYLDNNYYWMGNQATIDYLYPTKR